MRNRFTLLLLAGLLLSCGSKSRQTEPYDFDNLPEVEWTDSVEVSAPVQEPSTKPSATGSQGKAVKQSSSYTSSRDDETDNMRGFDPASEDDMDDNGMSRYMENDDDEGWD